jgi:hypothetical protein
LVPPLLVVHLRNMSDAVVTTGCDILCPTRRDGTVVQLGRWGDVGVSGDSVTVEVPTLREAGAADGALEGSGVSLFVPPISSNKLVGDFY